MTRRVAALVLTLVFALAIGGAASGQPSCQACDIALVEVYSDADGSAQFLMLYDTTGSTLPDGPSPLADQTLVAGNGDSEHAFTFPAELLRASRWILVGTQAFADLHLVTPDFIVPNGFLFTRDGSVTLRPHDFCARTLRYTALPTDGVKALYPNAYGDGFEYAETAQATNNAGQSYLFSPAAKFGGLWWSAPSGSESGWGIAVDHQGDTVFSAWATYDIDGSPTWLVMPAAVRFVPGSDDSYFGAPNTYLGSVYRTTGPPFNSTRFDPSAVMATQIGSGGFSFSTNADDVSVGNGDNSLFWLSTLGAGTIAKAVTREIFGSPVPVCVDRGSITSSTVNYQGMWWNESESGWGLYVAHQGDVVVATWFTYDSTRKPTWFVMSTNLAGRSASGDIYTGAIYRTTGPWYAASTFDPSAVTKTKVGSATLSFADGNNGAFTYAINGLTQTKEIARQVYADVPTVCHP